MLFTRIKLKNWKNFKEVDVSLNPRVFIIGPNASGKSNFLNVFRFLADVAKNDLANAVDMRGGISRIRCLAARKNPDISIEVTLDDLWTYQLVFGGKKGSAPLVRKENVRIKGTKRALLSRPDKKDQRDNERLTQTALHQVNANKNFREVATFFKTISYRNILPEIVRNPQDFSPLPVKNDPFGRDLVSQIWNTSEKIRDARLKKINEALKIAVPQLYNLDVQMDMSTGKPHIVVLYEHWRLHGAKQNEFSFSDGTLRLLALLWSLLEKGGPLLLEEPELSLHDEVVRFLPTMFAKLEKKRKKSTRQIFISTHSNAMLQDPGVGPGEVLLLQPGRDGTVVKPPDDSDAQLMRGGLSAAEVLLPKTRPENTTQLTLFKT